jgi:hypothetical protein
VRLSVKILRWLSPLCEHERMAFRKAISCNQAHAEDLIRTAVFVVAAERLLAVIPK